MNIILRNNLHFRALQVKLTPNLSNLVEPMKNEMDFALNRELPDSQSRSCLPEVLDMS